MLNEILRVAKSRLSRIHRGFLSGKNIFTITVLTIGLITITNAQGITNTLGGNTSADKFIVENSKSEAGLVVTGKGNVGIGITSPTAKLHISGDDGVLFTGTPNNGTLPATGTGTRMMWYPNKSAFRAGFVHGAQWDDANIGRYTTALGVSTIASEESSTAMGHWTIASGIASTAMGILTTASLRASTAMGESTTASGYASTAMGLETDAESYASVALGRYNIGGGNAINWVDTDPIFEIGIGLDTSDRNNALTVLKNGNVGIGNNSSPQATLHIKQVAGKSAIRMEYDSDTDYWETNIDGQDDYNFYYNGWLTAYILDTDGSYNAVSDRRLKRDIVSILDVLPKVLQLKPSNYRFKDAKSDSPLSTGLIAQDVQTLFPETVNEKNGYLSINYDAFAVIAIQAIKEQQQLIDDLTKRLEVLEYK